MSNGIRKGATIVAKHGKSAPRRRNPLSGYMKPGLQLVRDDHDWRSHALLGWPRGFSLEDAPPDRNEWTRTPPPCSNGPHRR